MDGIGIADLMAAAGLTHGAFYTYFDSKADLVEAACATALRDTMAKWEARPDADTPYLKHVVETYLSAGHAQSMGEGCALAALGGDIARSGPQVRAAAARGLERMVDAVAGALPIRSRQTRQERATAIVATMIGSLVMARIVEGDGELESVLAAGRDRALAAAIA